MICVSISFRHVLIPFACLIQYLMLAPFNAFKSRLGEFWSHQEVNFDFMVDWTGTENIK